MKMAAACLVAGVMLGCMSLLAQGPLFGDVALTRALQSVLGSAPYWAIFLTDSAKLPGLWVTLGAAMLLALAHGGWRTAVVPMLALPLVQLLDTLLRLLLFVPRPTTELVMVMTAHTSSGLPSTFGLIYGALFGVTICAVPKRNRVAVVASVLALLIVASGAVARIVLGGHWASQTIASVLIGFAVAMVIRMIIDRWIDGRESKFFE